MPANAPPTPAAPPAAPSTLEAPASTFTLDVRSETAPLEQVIVHTPGPEMELVSPSNRLDLLFEDILFVGNARDEHQQMCTVFEKIVGRPDATVQITDLLRTAFEQEDARHEFVEQLCAVTAGRNLQAFERELKRLAPDELYHFALTGRSPLPINLPPIPNLLFTRDVAAVVGDHIVLSHAATSARARESVIMRTVVHHHPGFRAAQDRVIHLPPSVTFEGGDLLTAAPDLVLVGHSERTSFAGVMALAQALFDRTSVEHVLMVDLPKARSCMHLDTVFTFTSPSECVVFPPIISEQHHGSVVHFGQTDEPGRFVSTLYPNLEQALETHLGRDLTFIPCGGTDPLNQEREQWTDGANFFAVAPGVVIGYERNPHTFEEMRRHGYRIVSAQGLLSYYEESDYREGDKVVVKLAGTELSRGRGGPRCMTLPLHRQPLTRTPDP